MTDWRGRKTDWWLWPTPIRMVQEMTPNVSPQLWMHVHLVHVLMGQRMVLLKTEWATKWVSRKAPFQAVVSWRHTQTYFISKHVSLYTSDWFSTITQHPHTLKERGHVSKDTVSCVTTQWTTIITESRKIHASEQIIPFLPTHAPWPCPVGG